MLRSLLDSLKEVKDKFEKALEKREAMWREEDSQKKERNERDERLDKEKEEKERNDRNERLDKEERADRWKRGLLEALKEVSTELSAIKKCIQK